MLKNWLYKNNNDSCILFFNGWGMDENAVKHLRPDGFDICMFNNYRAIYPADETEFNYKTTYLIAWSLGVCVANSFLKTTTIKISGTIGLNGSPVPMDNKYAIPEEVFNRTLQSWDEKNRTKFNLRMFGGKSGYDRCINHLSERSTNSQLEELKFIYKIKEVFTYNAKWDNVYIGKHDLIIPYENQKNFWTNKTKIIETDWPHFPFNHFKSWNEIIEKQV